MLFNIEKLISFNKRAIKIMEERMEEELILIILAMI